MAVNLTAPSAVEVDAAERVLADWLGEKPDGYRRQAAQEALEAARQAAWEQFAGQLRTESTTDALDRLDHNVEDLMLEDELERATGSTRR